MKECIRILDKLQTDFSYYEFLELLRKIDEILVNGYSHNLSSDFIFKLNNIMNFYVDKYVKGGSHITFGDMLLDNILSSKKKITPTLLLYFYLEKKKSLCLEQYCNEVVFLNEGTTPMAIISFNNNFNLLGINWYVYDALNIDNEQFNYILMHDVLHEIVHVYQRTRLAISNDLLNRLIFYDRQMTDIIIDKVLGGTNGECFEIHDALITEYMANEMADVYMLEWSKKSGYFCSDLIENGLMSYQKKKANPFYMYPRDSFSNLFEIIRKAYEQAGEMFFIQPILDEIENVKTQSLPIIEQLKAQGISENYNDSYFNIFLDQFYKFDGHDIIIDKEKVRSL